MKFIFNIINQNQKKDKKFNLDEIIEKYGLNYESIHFEKSNTDILKAFRETNKKINHKENSIFNLRNLVKHFDFNLILKPAYTIVITAIVVLTTIQLLDTTKETEYSIISVDAGERITLHVNKEVSIWLNSNSTIKIPRELNRRAAFYLDGEAFIKIENREKKRNYKFISGGIEFKTSSGEFHINSKNRKNELVAHISKGKIDCIIPLKKKSQKLTIQEGEKINFISWAGFLAKDYIHDKNYVSWKTGNLTFKNQNLVEVIDILSKYYDITFTIKNDTLKHKNFTATFNNPTIDQVLDKIMANYNCNITGDGNQLIIN